MINPFQSKFSAASLATQGVLPLIQGAIKSNGVIYVEFQHKYQVEEFVQLTATERLTKAVGALRQTSALLTHRSDRVARHTKATGCTLTRSRQAGVLTYLLKVDLPALLCLSPDKPIEALHSLHKLLSWCAEQMQAYKHVHCGFVFTNHKRQGKSYGTLNFYHGALSKGDSRVTPPKDQIEAMLQATIQQDTLLQDFIQEIARSLGKLGPWSSLAIEENCLFGKYAGPNLQWLHESLMREEHNASQEAVLAGGSTTDTNCTHSLYA